MKKKMKLPIILILLIFILAGCSKSNSKLEGNWKLINEEDETVKMYIKIDGLKGEATYLYDGEIKEVVYTILSAKDEQRYLYAFELDNVIELNLEGYFQDRDLFIAESGDGEYFRLESMIDQEFEAVVGSLGREKYWEDNEEN